MESSINTADHRGAHKARIIEKIGEFRRKYRIRAPEFPEELDWLNASALRLTELRGRIVLLDFWTYCCINCLHVLPDLKYLERKYAGQPLVVIGVHSAKFSNEKETSNIRQAILRYEIEHPVLVDSDFEVWQLYTVRAWPTLILIDPDGYILGMFSGEGNRELLDLYIEAAFEIFAAENKLVYGALDLKPELDNRTERQLSFPGKILANQKRNQLILADTNHHRLIVFHPDGKVKDIIGTGLPGRDDGDFESATFRFPQGMSFHNNDLILCDSRNHTIRRLNFAERRVTTIAGTGAQGRFGQYGGPGRQIALNSPWDIFISESSGYIAMAGAHQIWKIDLEHNRVDPFAGNGQEGRRDAALMSAVFAQPSGISGEVIDGQLRRLFVADSESSSVREINLASDLVRTVTGGELFHFGDRDGVGERARLQHPLGLSFFQGQIYVADTYNHKIKRIDPNLNVTRTLAGQTDPGFEDGKSPRFFEPGDVALLDDAIFIADTNNHAIRSVNLQTLVARTLKLALPDRQSQPAGENLPQNSNMPNRANLSGFTQE